MTSPEEKKSPDALEQDISTPTKDPSSKKGCIDDRNGKVFNDPIHGHFTLDPLLVAIIDTPQFQRLRYIKQLGGGYFVFPGASHNRFEHSLGVCYLAGEFVESLHHHQEELKITPQDILCVKIAGLCHDLGHGPFSHVFDGKFIPFVNGDKNWKHEQGSIDMLDHLISANQSVHDHICKRELDEKDIDFIKELIMGKPLENYSSFTLQNSSVSDKRNWNYRGRGEDKSFLYEIVANKRTEIDVDKWDYFARDCHCLGMANNFDWRRYVTFARVIEVNGQRQICCRDKEAFNLYEMFHTRYTLHHRAYQHKTKNIVEQMITEALKAANHHPFLVGKNGQEEKIKMSDAIHDMVAYTQLTDAVMQHIMISEEKEFVKAKKLFKEIEERKFYKMICQIQHPNEKLKVDVEKEIKTLLQRDSTDINFDDLIYIDIVTFNYGMKKKNPVNEMMFYTKENPNNAVRLPKEQVSQMLPHTFYEQIIRVYCKDPNKKELAIKCVHEWCKENNLISPAKGSAYGVFSPIKEEDSVRNEDKTSSSTSEESKNSASKEDNTSTPSAKRQLYPK